MKRLIPLLFPCLAFAQSDPIFTLVEFSTAYESVTCGTANDTTKQFVSPDRLKLTFGTTAAWPKINLCDETGQGTKWDLTHFDRIEFSVKNLQNANSTIYFHVDNVSSPATVPFTKVVLGPFQTRTVKLTLTGQTQDTGFIGIKVQPETWGDKDIDITQVARVRATLESIATPQSFEIGRIRAIGFYPYNSRPWSGLMVEKIVPWVDEYGQFTHADWTGKAQTDQQLRDEKNAETFNAAPADWNQYGGCATCTQEFATGHFRTEKIGSKWWLIDPDGYPFWSHGINVIRYQEPVITQGREEYFESLPSTGSQFWGSTGNMTINSGYYQGMTNLTTFDFLSRNLLIKYGADWQNAVKARVAQRLPSWGINTVGLWSDTVPNTPYVVWVYYTSPMIATKLPDMWSQAWYDNLDAAANNVLTPIKDDPYLLGVFVDNELRWDHITDPVALQAAAEQYYSNVRGILKTYAPDKLYLGSRINKANDIVIDEAAQYVDVMSYNIYADEPLLFSSHDVPVLVSEWHFGVRGFMGGGLTPTRHDAEQSVKYADYVDAALNDSRIVGAHWFQYVDEPVTGRVLDGENHRIGFVSVTDYPYQSLIDAARAAAVDMYSDRY